MTPNENLFDVRFIASGSLAKALRVDRHVAQVHQCKVFLLNFLNHDVEDGFLLLLVLREEDKASSIFFPSQGQECLVVG